MEDNMWVITKDKIFDPRFDKKPDVGVGSKNYQEGSNLPYKFRMLDDDGEIYYYGKSDDNNSEKAFAPLDDFGMPNAGCTEIQYYDKEKKLWETL